MSTATDTDTQLNQYQGWWPNNAENVIALVRSIREFAREPANDVASLLDHPRQLEERRTLITRTVGAYRLYVVQIGVLVTQSKFNFPRSPSSITSLRPRLGNLRFAHCKRNSDTRVSSSNYNELCARLNMGNHDTLQMPF